jgi:hypothetical protein
MCAAALPFVLMAAQAFSTYQASRLEAAGMDAEARTAEAQAKIKERSREDINRRYLDEKVAALNKMRGVEGANSAAAGAAGLAGGLGTSLDLSAANLSAYGENVNRLNWNLANDDFTSRIEVGGLLDTAANKRSLAKSTRRLGVLNTVLGIGSSLYSQGAFDGTGKTGKTGKTVGGESGLKLSDKTISLLGMG